MNVPIEIVGRVAHGRGLGRTLGVPTANIVLPDGVQVEWGVYAAVVRIEGDSKEWVAAVSLGARPTVEEAGEPILECFLIDYQGGSFYGQKIFVRLIQYLRGEVRFDSKAALVHQIEIDIEHVKRIVSQTNNQQIK